MKQLLYNLVQDHSDYVELRWHRRICNSFLVKKGRVDVADHSMIEGVGVRVLINGAFGFAATSDVSEEAIKKAIEQAKDNAILIANARENLKTHLKHGKLSTVDFVGEGFLELKNMSLADKLGKVIELEHQLANASTYMHTAGVHYAEYMEEKAIVTSDGANCSLQIAMPQLKLSAIAEKNGQRATGHKGAGVSGGWTCLFNHPSLNNIVEDVAKTTVDLIDAKYPEGGLKKCILAPVVVGLLCHEAIGHTVEADFVKAGSVAAGKIGHMVASPLVNMADSGHDTIAGYAVGNLPFDDEGVETENTLIIKDGKLASYLHNRETAHEFGVKPTGNARAWLFSDTPLIRMRNTYLYPGQTKLSDMIATMSDGYLIEGAGNGQADSNGEFMFGCNHVFEIKNGKKAKLLKGITLSGIAFDVLKTVDAVSSEFQWNLGAGLCRKRQPAKVDAGGPYIRCMLNLGGR